LYDGVGLNKDWTKSNLAISIWVADPCKTTTLKKVNSTFTTDPGLGALTVVNGSSLATDFTKALDTVEIAQGLDTLCGSRVYQLCYKNDCTDQNGQTTVTWATIAPKAGATNTFTLTLNPDSLYVAGNVNPITVGSANTLYLRTTLSNYSTVAANVETVSITVSAAICDCNKARWTAPIKGTVRRNVAVTNPAYTFPQLAVVPESVNTASNSPDADSV
jgi:hypothetical protein